MRAKYSQLYLIIAAVVVCSIAGHVVINIMWKDLRIINQPLHTAIEAIGATIAIFMTSLLQNKKQKGEYSGKFFLIAMGFLGMGLLEAFHSVSMPGKGFILLHSAAGLAGSLWFSMIWLPGLASDKDANWRRPAPWIVAGCCVLFSIWTMTARETLPAMVRDGSFTHSAIGINLLAGVLFAASAVRLMIDFHYSQKPEFIVFAGMSMVFGLAELTFPLSAPWDLNWWLRHLFHLMAYVLVLGFVIYESRHTEELEEKVKERTVELITANTQLVDEVYARKQVEKELGKANECLHNLAAHLQSIREEERTHIAREIHDELGQSLTALKFDMSWMEVQSAKLDRILSDKLKTDIEMVNSIIHSVKRICTELRPGILDHLGLGPAIEWQAEEFQKRSGIECRCFIDTNSIHVSADMDTALFRIFQESLTNILRHANATKVNVSLAEKGDKIILKIADNGIGITMEQLSKPNSFGLLGMRERMYPWGGEVSIQGNPNEGTEITVVVPATPLL